MARNHNKLSTNYDQDIQVNNFDDFNSVQDATDHLETATTRMIEIESQESNDTSLENLKARASEKLRKIGHLAAEFSKKDSIENNETESTNEQKEVIVDRSEYNYSPESEGSYTDGWEAVKYALLDRNENSQVSHEPAREYAAFKSYQAQRRAEFRKQDYESNADRNSQWYKNAKKRAIKTGRSIARFTKQAIGLSRANRIATNNESLQGDY